MKSFDVVAETRRRWPAEERRRIVAETEKEAVSVVARRHGVAVSLVFQWRRQAGLSGKRGDAGKLAASAPAPLSASFVPVALPAPVSAPRQVAEQVSSRGQDRGQDCGLGQRAAHGVIEIELAGGKRIRLSGLVETEALKQVIAVLDGR